MMTRGARGLLALLVVTTPIAASGLTSQSETDVSERLRAIEERYGNSLVRVRYKQEVMVSTSEPPQQEELTTTGIVVSSDGMIMTSGIVFEPFSQVPHGLGIRFPASVARAEPVISEARVLLPDRSEYPARLLGRDPEADVVFFRVEAEDVVFEPVSFGTPPPPAVGDELVVLSQLPDPFGPAVAVELTRVQSVLSRPTEGFLISTGAADPVGSLVSDLDGTPIGMVDAITVSVPNANMRNPLSVVGMMRSLPKGIGRAFARPARQFARAAAAPPAVGSPRRGWLGVEMQALTTELARHQDLAVRSGIIIGYVYRDSPAEAAGLETGDILVELEGDPIDVKREEELGAFAEQILRAGAGAELRLGYLRDGESHRTVAKLARAPKTAREADTFEAEELDLTVREITFEYLATRNLEPEKKGVVVKQAPVAVRTNPRRVRPGDLLVKIGASEVSDLRDFREIVETLRRERPEEVVLFVERGRESFFFALKPEWN